MLLDDAPDLAGIVGKSRIWERERAFGGEKALLNASSALQIPGEKSARHITSRDTSLYPLTPPTPLARIVQDSVPVCFRLVDV